MVFLTNFPPPTEGIQLSQPNTSATVGKRDMGNGTLFIAESRLSWVAEGGSGFSMEYLAISIHAISKDRNAFSHDCLYLQLACKLDSDEENSNSEEEEDNEYPITEVRFAPLDPTKLKEMYDALCHCQALHPDPDDSNSEDSELEAGGDSEELEEGDDFYGDQPDTEFISIEQQAVLDRYDHLLAAGEAAQAAANGTGDNHTNGPAEGQGESMEQGQFEDANDEQMQ